MTTARVEWTGNEELARMLDGLDTVPCAMCGDPCPVPEWVFGAVLYRGELVPIGLCEACSTVAAELVLGEEATSDE